MKAERQGVLDEIDEKKALDDALFARLKAAISTFNHQFGVEGYEEVADPGPSKPAAAEPAKAEAPKDAPKEAAKPKAAPRQKKK
jgi:hypothetical protein